MIILQLDPPVGGGEKDVHEQQRARDVIAPPAFQLVAERGAEAAAIGETRQVIAVGFGAQTIQRLLESDELFGARDEQRQIIRHLHVVVCARAYGVLAARRRRFVRADEDERHAVLCLCE